MHRYGNHLLRKIDILTLRIWLCVSSKSKCILTSNIIRFHCDNAAAWLIACWLAVYTPLLRLPLLLFVFRRREVTKFECCWFRQSVKLSIPIVVHWSSIVRTKCHKMNWKIIVKKTFIAFQSECFSILPNCLLFLAFSASSNAMSALSLFDCVRAVIVVYFFQITILFHSLREINI